MVTYNITGIKHRTAGGHTFISEVLLHEVDNNTVNEGTVVGKDYVIQLIKNGHNVYTATWNYTGISWTRQEKVGYETRDGQNYLRTTPDNSRRDNLLHMLPLENLGL